MTTTHRTRTLLGLFVLGCGLAACTTQEAKTDAGAGTGGRINTTGGVGGSGGSATGAGGYAINEGIACLPPTQMLTDFTYVPGDGAIDTTQVRFGTFSTTLSGGEDAYGSLISDVTGNDWHVSGTIADYSGWALYFDNVNGCNKFDASAFDGISFTIWGSAGGNMVTLGTSTFEDAVAYSWLDERDAGSPTMQAVGKCRPTSGTNQYYHPGCNDPTYVFAVTGTQASPQTVTIKWTDFMGGQPTATVTPTAILSMYFNVPWTPGGAMYPVDLHLDNLQFIAK
jgi:hypothetical protein